MTKRDIHGYEKRLKSALRRIEMSDLPEGNKTLLLEFKDYLFAEGISRGRIAKYMNHLFRVALWLDKPFESVTRRDIIRLVEEIENQGYTVNTKHDFKVVIKRFFKWLRSTDEYPEEVKWIKTTVKESNSKLPEELLTEEEVKRLIECADHPRNKAMVSLLYESGCRVGELLSLQIKHVEFDEYGAKVTVDGKTGMRRIRVVSCVPYLAAWIDMHPLRDNPDSPLWVSLATNNRNKPILYHSFNTLLSKLAKKAGIKKRIHPHIFRHSRATHLSMHLTEAQMNQYFGWVQGSDMPATYVHLSGRDVDDAILGLYGLKINNEKRKMDFSPIKCPRCEKMNPPASKFCIRCGAPLDTPTAMAVEKKRREMDELMTILLRDPEVRSVIRRKMMEIRIKGGEDYIFSSMK